MLHYLLITVNSKLKTQNSKLAIIAAYALMTLLVPPTHEYPINDDWVYAQSVRGVLQGVWEIPGWSQASQISHVAWGAGFSAMFGFSFTTLTWANLALALLGSLTFYAILRRLDVPPPAALLGTLLFALDPILIHLDYSFMTDTSFLSVTLIACYCYLRGFQDERDGWLWLGGAATALALLDRQFGVMVAVAALLYWRILPSRPLRQVFAIALLPTLALAAFLIWQAGQPPTEIGLQTADATRAALHDPLTTLWGRLSRLLITLPVLGLLVPTFHIIKIKLKTQGERHSPLQLITLFYLILFVSAVVGWYVYSGKVSFDYNLGNNLDSGGFLPPVLFHFPILTLWGTWFWLALSLLAATLTARLFAAITIALVGWWRTRPLPAAVGEGAALPSRREGLGVGASRPIVFVYIAGLLVGLPGLLLPANFMDRYLVPLLPFAIIFVLRSGYIAQARNGLVALGLVVALCFGFDVLAQRDYFAYAGARWAAGEWLVGQGVKYEQMDGGYEWNSWWLYPQAWAQVRDDVVAGRPVVYRNMSPALNTPFAPDALIDPIWRLEVSASDGYEEIRRFGYYSWLTGGETRYVLVLARPHAPSLPIR